MSDQSFEDVDLAEEVEAEVEAQVEESTSNLPDWAVDKTVTLYGRDFEIEEPSIGITLRIINFLGSLGIRGEKTALRSLRSLAELADGKGAGEASWRATIFGMLATINKADLYKLGSAVLQFEKEREGIKWLKDPPGGERLRLSPLIRAFWLNVAQGEDLKDSLNDFFVGLEMSGELLNDLQAINQ